MLIALPSFGQDTLKFEINTALMNFGELQVVKNREPAYNRVRYNLESKLKLWSVYNIHYFMGSVFENDILMQASSYIIVNGEYRHYAKTVFNGEVYQRMSLKDTVISYVEPIKSGVTCLYFNKVEYTDSIFSEYSGQYRRFIEENDSTYVLDMDDPMKFIFANNRVSKVIIPNSILDFYIEKKKQIN